ncbi:bacteriohemerythrin [Rhodocyclus tenuis]|uniref:bacteriohemerythrin n=1 Tax=Rhodocyclus gracilis TaxID=2929842 RepID=UPI001298DF93|nr:bacteriohemerythrin [Rhodocyclus gracilis]
MTHTAPSTRPTSAAILVVASPSGDWLAQLTASPQLAGHAIHTVATLDEAVAALQRDASIGLVLLCHNAAARAAVGTHSAVPVASAASPPFSGITPLPACTTLPAHVRRLLAEARPLLSVMVRSATPLEAKTADALWELGVADCLFTQRSHEWAASLATALREQKRRALHLRLTESPAQIAGARTVADVAAGVLRILGEQEIALRGGLFCVERKTGDTAHGDLIALAGMGEFARRICTPVARLDTPAMRAFLRRAWSARHSIFANDYAALFVQTTGEHTQPVLILLCLAAPLPDWHQRMLDAFTRAIAPAVEHAQVAQQLLRTQRATVSTLATLAEYKDTDTARHVGRVARMSAEIASALAPSHAAITPHMLENIGYAAVLHDLGKVGIPENILLKPGALNAEERTVINRHALIGHSMLSQSAALAAHGEARLFELAATIARSHHERYDGEGYPDRLAGENIPLAARIVAVVDVFDALISDRPYKRPWTEAQALAMIRREAGAHFDPAVVDAFLAVHERKRTAQFIRWTPAMSVGNAELDADHQRLVDIINDLGVNIELANHNTLEFILDDLVAYAQEHFAREEAHLARIDFPDRARHTALHAAIATRIEQARWKTRQGFPAALENELMRFLTRWLNHHILVEDMQYAAHTRSIDSPPA